MDDIVERLRDMIATVGAAWGGKQGGECFRAIKDAADEIEWLRERVRMGDAEIGYLTRGPCQGADGD